MNNIDIHNEIIISRAAVSYTPLLRWYYEALFLQRTHAVNLEVGTQVPYQSSCAATAE